MKPPRIAGLILTAIVALAAIAILAAPRSLYAGGGRHVCHSGCRIHHYPVVASKPVVIQGAPAAAPNYSTSTSSTDNSISYTYNLQYGQLPAAQGSTLYGYSDRSYTYPATDLGVDNLISQRLVADASAIQSKVLSGQQANAASAAEIAKLQIKGAIITSALNALADTSGGGGESQQATFTQNIQASASVGGASGGELHEVGGGGTASDSLLGQRVANVLTSRCVSCHGPTRQASNLDLSDLSKLDDKVGQNILRRVTHPDPNERMPFAAGDTPGTPLSLSELKPLFDAVPVE